MDTAGNMSVRIFVSCRACVAFIVCALIYTMTFEQKCLGCCVTTRCICLASAHVSER